MKATVILTRKTKASAEREAAWYQEAEPMNYRVLKIDGVYFVVRDWHCSDEGRSMQVLEINEGETA